MYSEELVKYAVRRARFKAKQVVRRVPSLGAVEDIRQDLLVDVLQRLPKFNGDRAAAQTFISRVIDNKIADMLEAYHDARDNNIVTSSCDDWVLDDDGRWVRRDAVIDVARARAHRGIIPRDDEESSSLAMDVAKVIATLPPELRELCVMLQTMTPMAIAKKTRLARSAVYRRIVDLRVAFRQAGLHLYG